MLHFSNKRNRTRGYAVVFVAIIMVPLLGFTSFAVDLGSWYAQGAKIQQVADASALAGAIFLPNKNKAIESAKQIAQANGYQDGVNGVTVTVSIATDAKRIKVDILVADLPRFFSQVLLKTKDDLGGRNRVNLKRTSIAEFIPQPRVGSARNYMGTGNCPFGDTNSTNKGWNDTNGPFGVDSIYVPGTCVWPSGTPYGGRDAGLTVREGWTLTHSGQCGTRGEYGMRFEATALATHNRYDGPSGYTEGLKTRCMPGYLTAQNQYAPGPTISRPIIKNPEYNRTGVYFGIVVPPGKRVVLEGFNIGNGVLTGSPASCGPANNLSNYSGDVRSELVKTTYTVIDNNAWDPRSPVAPGYTPIFSGGKYTTVAKKGCQIEQAGASVPYSNGWMALSPTLTNTTDEDKTYWLHTFMGDDIFQLGLSDAEMVATESLAGQYINHFSLRLKESDQSFLPCSSDPQDTELFSESCPSLYGVESINASFSMSPVAGDYKDFYLAEFGDNQIGNTVSVEIFDADWYSEWMAILPPVSRVEGGSDESLYQEFKAYILCQDGSIPTNEQCKPLTNSVQEVKPQNVDLGKPAGTMADGFVKYDMPKGKKFYLFRGPTPFSPGVSSTLNGTMQFNTNTWYQTQGNIPSWNALNTTVSGRLTTGSDVSTWTNSKVEQNFGTGSRVIRMDFVVDEPSVTGANEQNGYWWKLRFRNPKQAGGGYDGMNWTVRTVGEPVRLVPNIFGDVNWNT